jgi:multidrug transporter EmrE-like cation transporter
MLCVLRPGSHASIALRAAAMARKPPDVRRVLSAMTLATAITLLLLLGSVACDVIGQICFKRGVGHETSGSGAAALARKVLRSPWIGLGVTVYGVEFVLWFAALSRMQLSIAYPFTALGYVGVVLASRHLLGERISMRRWAGVAAIVIGVVLVGGQAMT